MRAIATTIEERVIISLLVLFTLGGGGGVPTCATFRSTRDNVFLTGLGGCVLGILSRFFFLSERDGCFLLDSGEFVIFS
jgi:hypothetical protein